MTDEETKRLDALQVGIFQQLTTGSFAAEVEQLKALNAELLTALRQLFGTFDDVLAANPTAEVGFGLALRVVEARSVAQKAIEKAKSQ